RDLVNPHALLLDDIEHLTLKPTARDLARIRDLATRFRIEWRLLERHDKDREPSFARLPRLVGRAAGENADDLGVSLDVVVAGEAGRGRDRGLVLLLDLNQESEADLPVNCLALLTTSRSLLGSL